MSFCSDIILTGSVSTDNATMVPQNPSDSSKSWKVTFQYNIFIVSILPHSLSSDDRFLQYILELSFNQFTIFQNNPWSYDVFIVIG